MRRESKRKFSEGKINILLPSATNIYIMGSGFLPASSLYRKYFPDPGFDVVHGGIFVKKMKSITEKIKEENRNDK